MDNTQVAHLVAYVTGMVNQQLLLVALKYSYGALIKLE